jgi:hypothetical protein
MEIAAMTTERSSYTDVFRQWVETSEQLNDRLDELRPAANSRLQDEIGRLHERRDELNAELIRLTAAGSV